MADVIEDLVNGHRANYYAEGADIIRTFYVTGLVSSPWAQLDEALSDPGIPQLFDPYPTPPANNLRVQNREAFPEGPNAVRVVVFYTNKPGPTWQQLPPAGDAQDVKQISASVSSRTTTLDAGGTPMLLNPPGTSKVQPYVSEATVLKPIGSIVFERTESNPPAVRMRSKVGRLNSDLVGSYAIRTLLFARLDAQSDDGGRNWRVIYEFRYDPDGWEHIDAFKLQTGKVADGAAVIQWDVYGAVTFGDLGLDFSDSQTPT